MLFIAKLKQSTLRSTFHLTSPTTPQVWAHARAKGVMPLPRFNICNLIKTGTHPGELNRTETLDLPDRLYNQSL